MKSSKFFTFSTVLIALLLVMAICLTGTLVSSSRLVAIAADLDAEVLDVEITTSVSKLYLGQQSQFEATVYYDDDTEGHEVEEWLSSNEAVATVSADGLVTAVGLGTTEITAVAGGVNSAPISLSVIEEPIHVVGIYLNKAMLVLKEGATETLVATVVPENADDTSVTWASDNEDAATVADGVVTSKGIGVATISATTVDGEKVASCEVAVLPTKEATINHAELTFMAVNAADQLLTVTLPEGVSAEGATYEWYSLYSDVASVDPDDADESICAVRPWRFGSTIVTVVVTLEDGTQYGAYSNVLVTSATFFITGEQNGWISTPETDWNLQGTNGIYTIKASLWSYSGFQIIHNDIDTDWTTKITPWWYDVARSSYNYVANTTDMFEVTTYGVYDVTLDLTQGIAKVYIVFDYAYTTSVGLDFAADSAEYLQAEDSHIELDITALPEGSVYDSADVRATVPEEYSSRISAEANGETMTVTITLLETIAEGGEAIMVPITVYIGEAYAEFDVVILPLEAQYVPVREIKFAQERYDLNVNNGAEAAWAIEIKANLNEGASIQQIEYTVNSPNAYVDVNEEGVATFITGALGTFTVTAVPVGNRELSATTTVYVYSSAFYLIGMINGEIPGEWIALQPENTSLAGTPFAPYQLTAVEGETAKYSITTTFNQFDLFSVVFLGMTGNWNGAINNEYLDEAASSMDYITKNGINVQINRRGEYEVMIDLSGIRPILTVTYVGPADKDVEVGDLYVYILRAGGAWDGDATPQGNIVATFPGYVDMTNPTSETTLSVVLNLDNFDGAWPTLQFVTATGISDGGDFENATWYDQFANVPITGDAFAATGAENQFTNDGAGCQMWLVGTAPYDYVRFTLTFDIEGNITGIEMNFVPVEA